MKHCLIITGGYLDTDFALGYIKTLETDKIIAVDAGLEAVKKMGLIPDAAVGDFDTVNKTVMDEFKSAEGILWDIHKPEKDETDTELAINTAISYGAESIVILGATGGRMDHTIGNIHLLYYCLKKGIEAFIVDEKNRLYLLDKEHEFKRDDLYGKYISFLPLTQAVKGITLTGFKYPLYLKDIEIGASLCISNELAENTGRIEFTEGVLICIEAHD